MATQPDYIDTFTEEEVDVMRMLLDSNPAWKRAMDNGKFAGGLLLMTRVMVRVLNDTAEAVRYDEDPIDELDLSARAYNVLKREGVTTIGQLCSMKETDLLELRNFHEAALADVKTKLAAHHRSLA